MIGVVCFLAFSIILLVFGGAFFGLIENLPKELDAHDSYQQLGQPHPKFSNKEEEEYQDFRKIAGFLGKYFLELKRLNGNFQALDSQL